MLFASSALSASAARQFGGKCDGVRHAHSHDLKTIKCKETECSMMFYRRDKMMDHWRLMHSG